MSMLGPAPRLYKSRSGSQSRPKTPPKKGTFVVQSVLSTKTRVCMVKQPPWAQGVSSEGTCVTVTQISQVVVLTVPTQLLPQYSGGPESTVYHTLSSS